MTPATGIDPGRRRSTGLRPAVWSLVLGLTLGAAGGLAADAVAQTIVVDTLEDVADPPFDSDGGTAADLPGADGRISLREAVVAANNTAGSTRITFAPSLAGGTIMVPTVPALTRAGTTIDGDLDGDGIPDVTLHGVPWCYCTGIVVAASDVTITGLRIVDFGNAGIQIDARSETPIERVAIRDTMIAGNDDGVAVKLENVSGRQVNDVRIEGSVFARHLVGVNLVAGIGPQASGNRISGVTIADNRIQGGRSAVVVTGGLSTARGNLVSRLTISGNLVTDHRDSVLNLGAASGAGSRDNRVEQVTITDNVFAHNAGMPVEIGGGSTFFPPLYPLPEGTSAEVTGNVFTGVTISGNVFRHNVGAVQIIGAFGDPSHPEGPVRLNTVSGIAISRNVIVGNSANGIFLNGGDEAPDNSILDATIVNNLIARNDGEGILLLPRRGPRAVGSVIRGVRIVGNTIAANEWRPLIAPEVEIEVANTLAWRNALQFTGCPGSDCPPAGPVFVDPDGDDFRLRPGASAVDAGDSAVAGLPATDLEGRPRVADGNGDGVAAVDLGAYELDAAPGVAADLAVIQAVAVDAATRGARFTVLVTNKGPDGATGVVLTDVLPPEAILGSFETSQGACTEFRGILTCALGSLAPGAVATVTVVAGATSAGRMTNAVEVTASERDPNTANNRAFDTGVFNLDAVTLTVLKTGDGAGTVLGAGPAGIDCGPSCSEAYPVGATFTLTATAAEGFAFAGWSGRHCQGLGFTRGCNVSMDVAQTVTATFIVGFVVALRPDGTSGTVTSEPPGIACGSGHGSGNACAAAFPIGTTVTLTATPFPGWGFRGWAWYGLQPMDAPCSGTGACVVSTTMAQIFGFFPAPDLVVREVVLASGSRRPGAALGVTVSVVNEGADGAPPSTLRLYLARAPTRGTGDRLLAPSRRLPSLAPGSVGTRTLRVALPRSLEPGQYFVVACADEMRQVAELVETNNCRASPITVVTARELVVDAVTARASVIAAGARLSVVTLLRNAGSETARASAVRVYLASVSHRSPSDRLLRADRIPPLAAGITTPWTTLVTVPSSTPPGSYFVVACADDLGPLARREDGGNCTSSSSRVVVIAPD